MLPTDTLTGDTALRYIENRLGKPIEELLNFPSYIMIETINACNSRCVMCGIDFDKKKRPVMTDQLFKKLAGEMLKHKKSVEKVMLYLDGEPLLDKKLPQRIKILKDGELKKVNIASNAGLLNPDMAEKLIEAGLDEIYITIDSLKKEIYESIRLGLKFDTVYDNILRFIDLRDRLNSKLVVRIQMILQKANYSERESFLDHWSKILSPQDSIIIQKAHSYGSKVDVMKFGDESVINRAPCIGPWGTFCVHSDGNVGLCSMDTDMTFPIGNVIKKNIAEIWTDVPLQEIRTKHISNKRNKMQICNGCGLWREEKHFDRT